MKNENIIILSVASIALVIMVLFKTNRNNKQIESFPQIPQIERPQEFIEIEEKLKPPLPEITDFPKKRNVNNLGKVLSDIEGHMPKADHIYRFPEDKITWGHETTHGINSIIRMEFSLRNRVSENGEVVQEYLGSWVKNAHGIPVFKSFVRQNGFYVLENQAVIIDEPNTTIREAAEFVPRSLRGGTYNLYMVQQARDWNDTPLYIFDEWVAYGNGAAVRHDLNIKQRQETVKYTLEFNVYAISVAMACESKDLQFKNFLRWNLERSINLYKMNQEKIGTESRQEEYLDTMRTATDANTFREFTRKYLGEGWTKDTLGF